MELICHKRQITCQHWKAPAPLTLSFVRHFVKLGHLSQLAAMADARIDVVICFVETLHIPSVSLTV